MRKHSINTLLAITVAVLLTVIILYWFTLYKQEPLTIEKPNINLQITNNATRTNNAIIQSDPVKRSVIATTANVDFSKYITDEYQIEEIRAITSRKADDLPVEVLANGISTVNLKNRWSTVHVVVVDEDGNKQIGEWAPNDKQMKSK